MAKTQFPNNRKISYKTLLGTGVALVAFFVLLTSVIGLGEKYFAIKSRTKELKKQQATLIAKEQSLMEQNAYLETPDGKAQVLRAKFNVVQPGEEMIVIMTPPEPELPPEKEQSRIGHWWDAIVHGLGFKKE